MSIESELVGKIQTLLRERYGDTAASSRQQLFAAYDANGDGEIDAKELTKLLGDAKIGNPATRGFWVQGVITRLDSDGNGTIGYEELEAILNSPD